MSLTLTLNQDPNTIVPGQLIEGTAGWSLPDAPRSALIRLFWYTEGKGTRDVGVVHGFLNEETTRKGAQARALVADAASESLLFLDGAEQLNPIDWHLLRIRAARLRGLVVTVHQPGRLPTLLVTHADEALLRGLLEQLVPGEVARYWPLAREHFARCGGNVREVLFALYDDWAAGEMIEPRMDTNSHE